jgi:hypothetical protein
VLLGAVEKSLIPYTDAFDESYQLFQRTTSSAASKAVNQLAIRFAAGDGRLPELARKNQDLARENDRLDALLLEAASKEPAQRAPDNEQQIMTQPERYCGGACSNRNNTFPGVSRLRSACKASALVS